MSIFQCNVFLVISTVLLTAGTTNFSVTSALPLKMNENVEYKYREKYRIKE